jgi:hypothetical protein
MGTATEAAQDRSGCRNDIIGQLCLPRRPGRRVTEPRSQTQDDWDNFVAEVRSFVAITNDAFVQLISNLAPVIADVAARFAEFFGDPVREEQLRRRAIEEFGISGRIKEHE